MTSHYELFAEVSFSAAHDLVGYPGDCAYIHGHNWRVRAYITCHKLNDLGIGLDFRVLKQTLREIVAQFDHTHLNRLGKFSHNNPTSENIARLLYEELRERLAETGVKVSRIEVEETPGTGVTYWED